MHTISETPQSGSVALVTYIPDPLRSFVDKLRQALPGGPAPQPHITILPRRPLKLAIDEALQQTRSILREVPPFEVELGKVRRFPETNYLYLGIRAGDASLRRLHDLLNTGVLHFGEEFEFRPHLTLGGPVGAEELDSVLERVESAWRSAAVPKRFTVDEVVLLWLEANSPQGEWRPLFTYRLEEATRSQKAASVAVTSQTL
jgi:2'-5' RNA ligase